MAKVTEFERVCIKKDGTISHRARYLFGTVDGRNSSTEDSVVIHPWHVSSGRGLSEQTIEDLKGMTASQAYMLSAYYKDAWEVLHGHKSKDHCIAVFPDETSWAIPFLLLSKGE